MMNSKKKFIEDRDKNMKINTEKLRNNRTSLTKKSNPQNGVDLLSHDFNDPIKKTKGIVDKGEITPHLVERIRDDLKHPRHLVNDVKHKMEDTKEKAKEKIDKVKGKVEEKNERDQQQI